MLNFFKKILFIFFWIFVLGGTFYLGNIMGQESVICDICPPQEVDLAPLWEAWHKLEDVYVDPDKLDTQKMIYGAIAGMVESLDDPYTVFFDPDKMKEFRGEVEGYFGGVGMRVGIKEDELTVIAPLKGTPAEKAGLRPGDKIIKVEDVFTLDLSVEEAVNLIRGEEGTKVTLIIFRNEWDESREVEIVRALIKVPTLEWELLDSATGQPDNEKGDIAYIQLYQFTEKSGNDFKSDAYDIINSPAKKIILDLRNNPGGSLGAVKEITGWFLERGDIIVIEEFKRDRERNEYKSDGNGKFLSYPTVVLINRGSASGSEILAGALRDNRGIKLIGETSFGKGSIQTLENLTDLGEGSAGLKITIANWLTPKGELITDVGLSPDIEVEMTDKDYEEDKDPQLAKALEIIKKIE